MNFELIDTTETVNTIANGATTYLALFSDFFVFAIGLTLAFAIITFLISLFTPEKLQEKE